MRRTPAMSHFIYCRTSHNQRLQVDGDGQVVFKPGYAAVGAALSLRRVPCRPFVVGHYSCSALSDHSHQLREPFSTLRTRGPPVRQPQRVGKRVAGERPGRGV